MVRLLIPSIEYEELTLNTDYQILIDSCIRIGRDYSGIIKLISYLPEVVDFTLAEWIYMADRLKLRQVWIVPAWARYTVRAKFEIKSWAPCDRQLSLYAITTTFLFNNKIKYWTSDRENAMGFLDFTRYYGEFYHVHKVTRRDSYSEWVPQEFYRNYNKKELVDRVMVRSLLY